MGRRERAASAPHGGPRGALAFVAFAALAFGVACSAEQGATPGQLTIALRTNMTPGLDFDELRMIVKRDDVVLQDLPYTWPRGGAGTPPMRFPSTYAIVNRTSGAPLMSVRFEAKQGGRLRIVREARTVLPTSGDFVLPVLLDWLCLDKIPSSSPTDVQCKETETCVAGVCTTPSVDATTLQTYEASQVFGGATSAGGAASGTCFDVLGTFDGSTTYTPQSASGTCGTAWSGGDSNVNVAVALPAGSEGFCYTSGVGGCFVPLEKGGASGWSVASGRLTVPARVCGMAGAKIAVVQGKPTKAENQPPCGLFSSVGAPDAGTSPTATIVVTEADAGARDAGGADATVADAGIDAGTADAGAPDAGPTDPCAGVACNTPPSAVCASGTSVTTYAAQGTCSVGACSYAPTTTACAAASCTGGVATAAGTCTNGACVAGAQTTCQYGCSGSACASCTPETDAAFCTRLGAACGQKSGTDNCGAARTVASCGTCGSGQNCSATNTCTAGASDSELTATTASLTGDGLNNCGPSGNDVCARSLAVTGGTFYRGTDTANPATISDFRLDKYEVTVGRFRKFVDAWVAGWRPSAGSGKHTHLNGGAGLANTAGGNEPGWDATWTAYVGAPHANAVAPTGSGATTKAAWDTNLSCDGTYATWSGAAGASEKRPMICMSWYDLYAFCIWDGGFLPSEAEWEYAAAGGSEERTYPWGNTAPAANTALAIYGCYYNGSGSCSGVTNIAPVGTVPAGASKAGQLDLAGNVSEWNLDWFQNAFVASCSNCTNLTASSNRVIRGGSYFDLASFLPAAARYYAAPAYRHSRNGGRCARTPNGGTCTAETDAAFCTRLGATCGAKSGTDNCGAARTVASCGTCGSGNTCVSNACVSSELTATTASLTGDGLNNCGASGNDVCARSLAVTGGTFYRGTDTANPATISDFRLDKYEVTVGRFRKFVDAWVAGWRPSAGAGKHTHLNGGAGLANAAGGNEPGWDATWTGYVGAPSNAAVAPTGAGATTKAAWDTNLSCDGSYQTWTSAAGSNEKRPQNCLSWYDLHAFCIWDGGFLPSVAEWEYAAAGGSEERTYPWGNTAPAGNTSLAIYGCYYNGTGTGSCSGVTNIAPVGTATAGASKAGHLDLAGNVFEWNLDWYQSSLVANCNNCTDLTAGSGRVVRGGSFNIQSNLLAAGRFVELTAQRGFDYGGRCARTP